MAVEPTSPYLIDQHSDPSRVDASSWNALLARQAAPTPFMRHEFLSALVDSGCAVSSTGWMPCWLTLHRDGALQAAAVAWLKSHSFGEYVFDWAWADAYRRHGLRYYPKLLSAVPFSPLPGTRLLAVDGPARTALIHALRERASARGLSSAHVLFVDETDREALVHAGWSMRQGVQFHWRREDGAPCACFEDFLASLQRDKRKKIQQERRRVADAGVEFTVLRGPEITPAHWAFFHRCYVATYEAHRSTPYLAKRFFEQVAQALPELWVMFLGCRHGEPVAASLIAVDETAGVAWGRYWGSTQPIACMHFEACYYQPLQWCIARGLRRFEGGAQGEHKMARGLLPVPTWSAHWLADARFADAVDEYLEAERSGTQDYLQGLASRSPFRDDQGGP